VRLFVAPGALAGASGAELRITGDVLQTRPLPTGSHATIVRFLDVPDGDANRIRRFVYACQVSSLAKEPA